MATTRGSLAVRLPSPSLWRPWHWFVLAAVIVVLDLVTKTWADAALTLRRPVEVLPFLNLTLVYNPGAAFGILADAGDWQRWFLIGVTILLGGFIAGWLARGARGKAWLSAALALILAGAIGNLIDRLLFGHVIDFIDIHAFGWHWPAFNVADMAITCGALLLIVLTLLGRE